MFDVDPILSFIIFKNRFLKLKLKVKIFKNNNEINNTGSNGAIMKKNIIIEGEINLRKIEMKKELFALKNSFLLNF